MSKIEEYLNSAREEIKSLERQKNSLCKENEDLEKGNELLKKQRGSLIEKISNARKQLKEAEAQQKDITVSLKNLEKQEAKISKQEIALIDRKKEIEKTAEALRDTERDLAEQGKKLSESQAQFDIRVAQKEKEFKDRQVRLEVGESDLKAKLKSAEDQKEKHRVAKESYERQSSNLIGQQNHIKEREKALVGKERRSLNSNAELNQKLAEVAALKVRLEKKLKEADDILTEAKLKEVDVIRQEKKLKLKKKK